MSDVITQRACEKCGGQISTEQIIQKAAGLVNGVLMCPACVDEKRKELIAIQQRAMATAAPGGAPRDEADEKLMLIDEVEMGPRREAPKIKSFSEASTLTGAHNEANLKRSMTASSDPATRCRTFHSKLTPAALAHMDEQINEFLDSHADVYMKFATTAVGMFEAKLHPEPHLVLTIFY